jgi:hypothetical protein
MCHVKGATEGRVQVVVYQMHTQLHVYAVTCKHAITPDCAAAQNVNRLGAVTMCVGWCLSGVYGTRCLQSAVGEIQGNVDVVVKVRMQCAAAVW